MEKSGYADGARQLRDLTAEGERPPGGLGICLPKKTVYDVRCLDKNGQKLPMPVTIINKAEGEKP